MVSLERTLRSYLTADECFCCPELKDIQSRSSAPRAFSHTFLQNQPSYKLTFKIGKTQPFLNLRNKKLRRNTLRQQITSELSYPSRHIALGPKSIESCTITKGFLNKIYFRHQLLNNVYLIEQKRYLVNF